MYCECVRISLLYICLLNPYKTVIIIHFYPMSLNIGMRVYSTTVNGVFSCKNIKLMFAAVAWAGHVLFNNEASVH